MTEPVFLDSGIFIAFLNSRDQWHAQARLLFDDRKARWRTSYLVISETYSWFLHRHGEEAARTFRIFIDNLNGLRIFTVDRHQHLQTARMLDRLRGTKLTYVDASSLAFMESHNIRQAWSTDRHLSLLGAEVQPRT